MSGVWRSTNTAAVILPILQGRDGPCKRNVRRRSLAPRQRPPPYGQGRNPGSGRDSWQPSGGTHQCDPQDKAEVYQRLGMQLTYVQGKRTVHAEVALTPHSWGYGLCPRRDSTTTHTSSTSTSSWWWGSSELRRLPRIKSPLLRMSRSVG